MPAEREHGYNDCRHLGKGEGMLDCTGSISVLLVCRRPQGRQQCAWKGGLGQQVLRLSGEEGQTYSAGNVMSQKAFKQFTAINYNGSSRNSKVTPGKAVWRETQQKATLTVWQDEQGWKEGLSVGLGKNSIKLPNRPCSSTCSAGHRCPNNLLAYWLSCSFLKSKIPSRLAWEEM